MKYYENKRELKEVYTTEVKETLCNKCGKSFVIVHGSFSDNSYSDGEYCLEMHKFSGTGGFDSVIGDGKSWKIDICDNCWNDFLMSLKIPYQTDELYICALENINCKYRNGDICEGMVFNEDGLEHLNEDAICVINERIRDDQEKRKNNY